MKTIIISIVASVIGLSAEGLIATYKTDQAASDMSILGTSTLHDWEMTAESMEGMMDVDVYDDRIDINSLQLSIPVKSLESGKSAMDKNAYEALKYKQHKEILYKLTEVKHLEQISDNTYKLMTKGKLSIAGETKLMSIPITAIVQNGSLFLKGTTTFKMTEFGVEPPSFMFGSVSTGDEITINFNINYKST